MATARRALNLLVENHESYDAKAIVGAAYAFLPPRYQALTRRDFGSRERTTKQWLERLGFTVVEQRTIKSMRGRRVSERLDIGNLYSRAELRRILGTNDATLMTGVFRPPGTDSIFLFVTEHKTADRTQFEDSLRGDTLRWQGQLLGRTDPLIAEHARRGLELLVFYRREKYEYPEAAFRYEGIFRYQSHRGAHPTSFVLVRESRADLMDSAETVIEKAFDPDDVNDDREKVATIIARRRGREKFRASLLSAYGGRCVMTGCDFAESLEAAHIYPYKGDRTDHATNGLLLRADVHTLFDLGWIAINPTSRRIVIHPLLRSTTYGELAGRRVAPPRRPSEVPSKRALRWHLDQSRIAKLDGPSVPKRGSWP